MQHQDSVASGEGCEWIVGAEQGRWQREGILIEKLVVSKLLKKLVTFYVDQTFHSLITISCHFYVP